MARIPKKLEGEKTEPNNGSVIREESEEIPITEFPYVTATDGAGTDELNTERFPDMRDDNIYQRQLLLTFVRPVPQSDGHDRLWLIDELVPSFATGLDDGVIIFEDAVGEPILAQVLPDILDRVQLG